MKKIAILLTLLAALFLAGNAGVQAASKKKAKARTHRVVKKKSRARSKVKSRRYKKPAYDFYKPTIHENPYLLCEDTCEHVHGIDLSHYQGEVFWDAVGENARMAYVYLKATEGSERIDARYERNIELAHHYGLKVGSYHFFRPRVCLDQQLANFKAQCLPGEQDLIPMLDVETTGGLATEEFCDSVLKFLVMLEDAYHQKPLVYTGRNFYNKYLLGKLDDYQLMIAMYSDNEPVLADERDICLWQYSGKGRINGVSGYVDKSRFMGSHGLREIRFRH